MAAVSFSLVHADGNSIPSSGSIGKLDISEFLLTVNEHLSVYYLIADKMTE